MTPRLKDEYGRLLRQLLSSDDPAQVSVLMDKLSAMTGFDQSEKALYLAGLADEAYAGTSFSKAEIVKAELLILNSPDKR